MPVLCVRLAPSPRLPGDKKSVKNLTAGRRTNLYPTTVAEHPSVMKAALIEHRAVTTVSGAFRHSPRGRGIRSCGIIRRIGSIKIGVLVQRGAFNVAKGRRRSLGDACECRCQTMLRHCR